MTANVSIRITRRIVHIKITNTCIIPITIIAAKFRNTPIIEITVITKILLFYKQ